METRNLGRTGVKVSPLCLGTMNFGGPTPEADSIRIIHRALDAGINFLDTANMYNAGESERVVGKALAGGRRPKVILATKVHFPQSDDPNDRGNSRRHILQAIEDSLRRLNTDWVDLYQIHRPVFDMPQDETLRALDDLVHQGKVRYIGCSTFPAWMVMEALALSERYGLARYVTEQPPLQSARPPDRERVRAAGAALWAGTAPLVSARDGDARRPLRQAGDMASRIPGRTYRLLGRRAGQRRRAAGRHQGGRNCPGLGDFILTTCARMVDAATRRDRAHHRAAHDAASGG